MIHSESTCFGKTKKGKLLGGVQLESHGKNYQSYSSLGVFIGRNYVHSKVKAIIEKTYDDLLKSLPNTKFVYAETGWKNGGSFKPHKTHQNGLSVDFMVPIKNSKGESVFLPTNVFNKWGYSIDFDLEGNFQEYKIDYDAMSSHIRLIHENSLQAKIDLWRVIFDPKMQADLLNAKEGKYIQENIKLSSKRSWVRHDEHYHIDFDIQCEVLKD